MTIAPAIAAAAGFAATPAVAKDADDSSAGVCTPEDGAARTPRVAA